MNGITFSKYSVIFDSGHYMWYEDKHYNELLLKHIENNSNDLLRSRGYLFLNEVYKMLGFPMTKEGQLVGWKLNNDTGDNYVKFNIVDKSESDNELIIDFNVCGKIIDLI